MCELIESCDCIGLDILPWVEYRRLELHEQARTAERYAICNTLEPELSLVRTRSAWGMRIAKLSVLRVLEQPRDMREEISQRMRGLLQVAAVLEDRNSLPLIAEAMGDLPHGSGAKNILEFQDIPMMSAM